MEMYRSHITIDSVNKSDLSSFTHWKASSILKQSRLSSGFENSRHTSANFSWLKPAHMAGLHSETEVDNLANFSQFCG